MKKLLSVILALVMILSLSTVAFAADVTYEATPVTKFEQIVKTYNSENDKVVYETLHFTSTHDEANPTTDELAVDDLVVASVNPGKIKVTIPSLNKAGTYRWTIHEVGGNSAGVTYSQDAVHVIVLVEYNNHTHSLQIAEATSYIEKLDGTKADTFTNTFKSGSFTVAKEVTGNMANENDEFEITVKLTSDKPVNTDVTLAGTVIDHGTWTQEGGRWTTTSVLKYSKAGGAKTFSDIPEGVTVSVVENTANDMMDGYTYVDTNGEGGNNFSMTVSDDDNAKAVVVKNEKKTTVETGVTLDSLPYVLLLAVACVGMAVVLTKKRRED